MKIFKFWAEWCQPCKMLENTVKEILAEDNSNIELISINVDEETDISRQYKIRSIPTLLKIKDGTEVGRLVGNHPKSKIKEFLS